MLSLADTLPTMKRVVAMRSRTDICRLPRHQRGSQG